jgi:hypothetical protein
MPNEMGSVASMQTYVVPDRVDPVYVRHPHEIMLGSPAGYEVHWTPAFCRDACGKGAKRLVRYFGGAGGLRESSAHTGDGGCEPLGAHGLEEIVDGVHFERADRILVIGGHEYDCRKTLVAQGTHDLEAIELGELNVEEDEIGLTLGNEVQRAGPIFSGPDELEVRLTEHEVDDPLSWKRFVVDDYYAHGHSAV